MGFEKLQSSKDKSQVDKAQLMGAAQKLGIESQVEQIFDSVDPRSKSYAEMNSVEREIIDKQDIEKFSVPPITQAHRPFEYDDLPSKGHIQLREHRIQREYNRVAAYDLPQLASLARPYNPLPENQAVLQFKYYAFLGEEHPASGKVSVRFSPSKLSGTLTAEQQHKLKLLAGSRYNAKADVITISCQRFAKQAQNKRWLADTIKKLLAEAKSTCENAETDYSSLPLDTRHITARQRRNRGVYPNYEFPAEWNRPQDAPKPREDLHSVMQRGYSLDL